MPAHRLMGALSRQDEKAMFIGCGCLLMGIGVCLIVLGFAVFKIVQWVFS